MKRDNKYTQSFFRFFLINNLGNPRTLAVHNKKKSRIFFFSFFRRNTNRRGREG